MDKLEMIVRLEGRLIQLARGDIYCLVTDGKFYLPGTKKYVTLSQCEVGTIERYYQSSVENFECLPAKSQFQQQALDWFASLSPEARTIQISYLLEDRIQRTRRIEDQMAGN